MPKRPYRPATLDSRLDLPCELLEHQVLVLHLRDEAGGLEEPLAVPPGRVLRRRKLPLGQRRDAYQLWFDANLRKLAA